MMMEKKAKKNFRLTFLRSALLLLLLGILSWFFFFTPTLPPHFGRGWKTFTRESRRLLGLGIGQIPPEEKRIREEVILKKMEEASTHQDWRSFAPEYPRPKKLDSLTEEEKTKVLKNSPEFQEMDEELKEYLRKKEDLFNPELPIPSVKDATDFTQLKDRGAEKVV